MGRKCCAFTYGTSRLCAGTDLKTTPCILVRSTESIAVALFQLAAYDPDVRFKSDGVTGDRIMLVDQMETEIPKLAMSSDEPY